MHIDVDLARVDRHKQREQRIARLGHEIAVGGAHGRDELPVLDRPTVHEQVLLAGVGPADVYNRDPRELPLVSGGATVIGTGILARAEKANVVFCQLAP